MIWFLFFRVFLLFFLLVFIHSIVTIYWCLAVIEHITLVAVLLFFEHRTMWFVQRTVFLLMMATMTKAFVCGWHQQHFRKKEWKNAVKKEKNTFLVLSYIVLCVLFNNLVIRITKKKWNNIFGTIRNISCFIRPPETPHARAHNKISHSRVNARQINNV